MIIKTLRIGALTSALALVLVVLGGATLGVPQQEKDQNQWTASSHDNTNFPLIGRHRTTECRDCHLGLVFEGTPSSCEACHWERRRDDRYRLRLGAHCADCHTPLGWKRVPANRWNHGADAGFPLSGVHRTLDCVDCHGDLELTPGSADCLSCHAEDYQEAREPNHAAAGFPTQCQICHRGNNRWEGALFSHDFFPLGGQHRFALCSSCHSDGRFAGLSTDCYACHVRDFNQTKDPDHLYLGFPTDCAICHGSAAESWDNGKFSHGFFTLRGNHKTALCLDCHLDGQFYGLSQECAACHLGKYQGTEEPDHMSAGFPADCAICHGTKYTTWEGAEFTHTSFVLKGQHKQALCLDCHGDGQFEGRPSACVSCHLADYNSASDPNHNSLGFPTGCELCHGDSAVTWEGAVFSHDAFVLMGQHRLAACSECHINSATYISSDCVSCHLDDYNRTTEPDHRILSFPLACEACHGTLAQAWEGAVVDHSFWPLQGAHTGLDCSSCHATGTEIPSECYGCHADDYDATSDPNHQDAGFPTYCEFCHYPTHLYWTQAVFDHQFPLTSGAHGTLDCTDCHLTANYKEFACIECHAHNQTRMGNKHRKVVGYVYASVNCYACHPDGRE
jgi:hypothetical protein